MRDWIKMKDACEILSRGRIGYGVSIGEIRKKKEDKTVFVNRADVNKFKNRPKQGRTTDAQRLMHKGDLECLKKCLQMILNIKGHHPDDDPFLFASGSQVQSILNSIEIFQKKKHNAMAKS